MSEPGTGALLRPWSGTVLPAWTDYNGHLRDAYYLLVFSMATDAMMDMIRGDLAAINIRHDVFFSERQLHGQGGDIDLTLAWLRAEHAALSPADRAVVDSLLAGTGCEALFG